MGERFVDGKLGGVVPVGRGEGAELAEVAESENAGLEGAGALEAPVVFGDGLGEFELERAHGLEGFADAGAVLVEGCVLIGGEKADLAGEAVTTGDKTGVEAGAMLAFFGFRAGRFLGVGEVGFLLRCGGHMVCFGRSPWGRATDLQLARRPAAASMECLYRIENIGTIYLRNL